jgi:hypothetical protein
MPGTAPARPTIKMMISTIRIEPTEVPWVVPAAAWAAGGRTVNGSGELEAQPVLPDAVSAAVADADGEADGDGDAAGDPDACGDADAVGDAASVGDAVQVAAAVGCVPVVFTPTVVPPPVVPAPPSPPPFACEPPPDDVDLPEPVGLEEDVPFFAARTRSSATTALAWVCRLEVSGR